MPLQVFRALAFAAALAAPLWVAPDALMRAVAPEPQSGPLRQSWWDRTDPGAGRALPRSRFYAIRSDLPAAETKLYADHLDTMYAEYSRLTQGLRRRGKEYLDVYMFASERDYLDTLRTKMGATATGSGGMFFVGPKGAGLAFFTEGIPRSRVEHVIRHEGFHQFAYSFFENDLPPWANEGLAEYFGEASVVDGKVIEGQASPRAVTEVKKALEAGTAIPFLDMLTRDSKRWNAAVAEGRAGVQYPQAWSMVQFLLWGEGGALSRNFSAYLRHVNDGRDSVSAFRMAFGGTDDRAVADFERRWRAFAAVQVPSTFRAALERMEFYAEGLQYLRARNVVPATMEELREALVRERFTSVVGGHGQGVTLRPEDPAMWELAADSLQDARKPPVFDYVWKGPKPRKAASQEAAAGEGGDAGAGGKEDLTSKPAGKPAKTPPPPEVITRSLLPRNLKLTWIRGKGDQWTYDISVK